jgi:hypothetical protein
MLYICLMIIKAFFTLFCRNYNPVERRVKGGKDRNIKGLRSSKSLQSNAMNNSGSGDALNLHRTSGWLIGIFDSKLFSIFPRWLIG